MRKVFVVAMREYQSAVRTKAFIISLVLMPVLMGGSILLSKALEGRVDITDKPIAVMDRSGAVIEPLLKSAEEYNRSAIVDPVTGTQIRPRYLFTALDAPAGEPDSAVLAGYSERVLKGEWYALAVIGPGILDPVATDGGVDVYSEAAYLSDFRDWFRNMVNEAVREVRLARAGLPKRQVDVAMTPVTIEALKPLRINQATGEITGGDKKSKAAEVGVPIGMMFMMFMVITVGAAPLINSVLEEKMQRIAEVLLGSVSPFELMAGKLLGVVGVSLTILCVYLLGGVIGAKAAGQSQLIPSNLGILVVWFLAFSGLAVLMFGSMFVAVGAACSDMKEAQNMLTPVWMIVVSPMFVWFNVVREPTSVTSLAFSLFPPATPMLMMLRTAAAPSIPIWQPLLGIALVIGTTVLCVFAAGRIFRIGILMQGRGAKFTDLMRWAVKG